MLFVLFCFEKMVALPVAQPWVIGFCINVACPLPGGKNNSDGLFTTNSVCLFCSSACKVDIGTFPLCHKCYLKDSKVVILQDQIK